MPEAAAPTDNAASAGWWVQVRGQAYGPYSLGQLAAFVAEGRVRPATQVSDNPHGRWMEARRVQGLMPTQHNESAAGEGANIFIHVEILSGNWMAFMAALETMGPICELSPGLWLLRTRFSVGIVRNMLSQTLQHGDRFVAVDATRNRLAWFNLGPEIDVHIKNVWNGPLRAEAKSA